MKRLLTPLIGTTLYAMSATLTGGRDYVLVSEDDSYASNLVLNQKLTALATGEKIVLLPDEANLDDLNAIVTSYKVSKPWDKEKESYEEYTANAYRFAAEAYTAELNGEAQETVEQPKTRRKTTETPAETKTETE